MSGPGLERRRELALLATLVALLLLLQLVRPARTNPPENPHLTLWSQLPVDPATASLLDRACVDCHSDRTRWPAYSAVAPVSWLVARDVTEGRHHLNLSEWGLYQRQRQGKLLQKMCKEAEEGDMPPPQYTLVHRGAKLSKDDVTTLCAWTRTERRAPSPP